MLLSSSGLEWQYRCDGIDGIDDCEQKHVVDAAGVIRVPGPGDLLAGGVIDEGRVVGNVNLVLRCVCHSIAGAIHILVLHQGLAFLGHHHHIAAEKRIRLVDCKKE